MFCCRREKYVSRTNYSLFDDLDDGVIGQPIARAKTEMPADDGGRVDDVMDDKYLPSITLDIDVTKEEAPDDIMADLMAAAGVNTDSQQPDSAVSVKLEEGQDVYPEFDLPEIKYNSSGEEEEADNDSDYNVRAAGAKSKRRGRGGAGGGGGVKKKPKKSQQGGRNFIKASDDALTGLFFMHENRYSIQNQLETIQNRKCWLFLHLVPPQVHHFNFSRTTVD